MTIGVHSQRPQRGAQRRHPFSNPAALQSLDAPRCRAPVLQNERASLGVHSHRPRRAQRRHLFSDPIALRSFQNQRITTGVHSQRPQREAQRWHPFSNPAALQSLDALRCRAPTLQNERASLDVHSHRLRRGAQRRHLFLLPIDLRNLDARKRRVLGAPRKPRICPESQLQVPVMELDRCLSRRPRLHQRPFLNRRVPRPRRGSQCSPDLRAKKKIAGWNIQRTNK